MHDAHSATACPWLFGFGLFMISVGWAVMRGDDDRGGSVTGRGGCQSDCGDGETGK